MSIETEFKTVKQLVEHVLEQYPETRDNDTLLYTQCAKELGAETIEDLNNINLNIISVHKLRQVIQNKEGKWKASEKTQKVRNKRRIEIRDYMRKIAN
ncbi:hypothetical protein [Bacillus litorisediminis]|uniref:hypothetical protein n=1 Tax=Bacillus litorisediminis TaxID=2922713 RepID=UPI001FAEB0C8|nr:hypothetical protein [Bacillus litorisediminis]